MRAGIATNSATGTSSAVLVHRLPHPPHSGADMRNWQHIRALGSAGRVAVLGLGRDTERPACPGLSVWRTSSDPTFAAATQSGPTTMLSWLRDSTGHPSNRWFSPVASAELIDLVHEAEADVIVVGSSWLHGYIPALREAGCRVVLDMQNLEGPLHAELADARGDRLSAIFAERTLAIEARAIQSVDQVWVCSDHDAHAARDTYPSAAPIAVVPNTIEVERYGAIERSYGGMTLVYPGAFEYPPNRLAAGRLIE